MKTIGYIFKYRTEARRTFHQDRIDHMDPSAVANGLADAFIESVKQRSQVQSTVKDAHLLTTFFNKLMSQKTEELNEFPIAAELLKTFDGGKKLAELVSTSGIPFENSLLEYMDAYMKEAAGNDKTLQGKLSQAILHVRQGSDLTVIAGTLGQKAGDAIFKRISRVAKQQGADAKTTAVQGKTDIAFKLNIEFNDRIATLFANRSFSLKGYDQKGSIHFGHSKRQLSSLIAQAKFDNGHLKYSVAEAISISQKFRKTSHSIQAAQTLYKLAAIYETFGFGQEDAITGELLEPVDYFIIKSNKRNEVMVLSAEMILDAIITHANKLKYTFSTDDKQPINVEFSWGTLASIKNRYFAAL